MRLEKEKLIAACQESLLPCVRITPSQENAGPADSKFGGKVF